MRSLVVTNLYPTPEWPYVGTFVDDQVRSLRALGIEIEVLHVRREAQGMGVYRGLRRLVTERAQAAKPDLVHVMYGGVMADAVTRAHVGAPVLVAYCGTDLLGSSVGKLGRRLRGHVGVFASRRAAPKAAAITVKSSIMRAALPSGLDESRVWTIPDGVDTDRFAPEPRESARARLGWPADEVTVLFPALPTRSEKRFELARAAVAELEASTPDVRLRWFEGVPHSDVPTWMNAVDAVVLTSTHEGSPNVVKEALACCVPVVSVDVGDVRERIDDVPGCAVVDADPRALASALEAAVASGRSPLARVRAEEVSLPRIAERIAAVYEAAVKARLG